VNASGRGYGPTDVTERIAEPWPVREVALVVAE
jgi:hypothetical protein